jgi:high affinity Mn2+ porin
MKICNFLTCGLLVALPFAQTCARAQAQSGQDVANQAPTTPAATDQKPKAQWPIWDLQGEFTTIYQTVPIYHSPYQGANSFPSHGVSAATDVGTFYVGFRPIHNLEFHVNAEVAWGNSPGNGAGVAAYPNSGYIGQLSLNGVPYISRAFLRWRIPIRSARGEVEGVETIGRAQNIMSVPVTQSRLVVTAGKLSLGDVFDFNSYANNQRIQFINKMFVNNLAYDFAQDVRGYDYGAALALVEPKFSIRAGSFAVPTSPGSTGVTYGSKSHGDQIEVDLYPTVVKWANAPMAVRILAFRNQGFMGQYADALASALPGTAPDLSGARMPGTVRTGYGINLGQSLADDGNTGLFFRAGWADGNVEAESYSEADTSFSIGGQLAGARWRRPDDNIGFAVGTSGISSIHQKYLGAGGLGLSAGDGALRYGTESVAEFYYLLQQNDWTQWSFNVQYLLNPGFNRDRGPATVLSLRLRFFF